MEKSATWDNYCLNDDSSSLGYGSGCSTSSSSGSDRQDFYKLEQPVAEFYDLDSVSDFYVGNFSTQNQVHCPYCLPRSKTLSSDPKSKSNCDLHICDVLDEVHPSADLIASVLSPDVSEKKLSKIRRNCKINNFECDDFRTGSLSKHWRFNKLEKHSLPNNCTYEISKNIKQKNVTVDCDQNDHIYEEIRHDSHSVNVSCLQPPPLPARNFVSANLNIVSKFGATLPRFNKTLSDQHPLSARNLTGNPNMVSKFGDTLASFNKTSHFRRFALHNDEQKTHL